MSLHHDSIHAARKAFLDDPTQILAAAQRALAHANGNQSRNTYLWRDEAYTLHEANRAVEAMRDIGAASSPLCGMPISIKDCFDLAGSPTSCGTRFYRDGNGTAQQDSWLVAELRKAGAVITGKTHLHPLAYGITGENPDFGDCLQPGDPTALTGGSSSGAAASILEGSAIAAIGTDTGGSIRVPAALCGIAGYRSSLGYGDWQGGAHLAQSFDTMGWLFRNLEDAPLLASIFGIHPINSHGYAHFAVLHDEFLTDCEPEVLASYRQSIEELKSLGLKPEIIDVSWWHDSREIFAPIQASEAAKIHAGCFHHFESSIPERLEWGASLSADELSSLRSRHAAFQDRMDVLLTEHQLLLMPCAPVTRLPAGADHSQTRARLLRYTTPVSLAGMPAVTLPYVRNNRPAGGMQLVAAHEDDARLLALAAQIGAARRAKAS